MAKDTFYQNLDLKYPETAILQQRCRPGDIGSFLVPVLTPYQSSYTASKDTQHLNASNLMNAENNIGISTSVVSNTISLKIPNYLGNYAPQDMQGYIIKGTKFIVSFIGGDINQPKLIGGDW